MIKSKIHHLFPEPIYFSKLERAVTKEELKTIDSYEAKSYNNTGNITSLNHYVLEKKGLNNLKKDLYKRVVDYFDKVVCPSNSIIPYITQSWLNYTETSQFHHRHTHSNSYISGVFYINADEEIDKVMFFKEAYEAVKLEVTTYNMFNSRSWWYAVKTGDILLFPSFLQHGVENKKGNNKRISLGFNVFLKGRIGSLPNLTALTLK